MVWRFNEEVQTQGSGAEGKHPGCPSMPIEHCKVIMLSGRDWQQIAKVWNERWDFLWSLSRFWYSLNPHLCPHLLFPICRACMASRQCYFPGASWWLNTCGERTLSSVCHIWLKFPFGCGRKLKSKFSY